ncbi:MAG: RNA polymerase sporulation sigma factor SigH [Bacteroidales bacterium]|nr:RNA polymerase sporulation sigma factor SigH [Clostridium sp.]MCM1204415.1 RNA polymerase sporulation sigma factor SigH [Bacteroidales bacterium]
MNYEKYTDEELVALTNQGDHEATEYLLKKYSPLVKKSIRTLYLIGADTEDLSQEGMIGLFKAIQHYETENSATFYTFAKLCIDRQIYSAIKASNRKKHSPLNTYISFYSRINEDEVELIDNLEAGNDSNPEHIILDRENTSHIEKLLEEHLSKMEKEILPLYLDGLSYADIALSLNKPVKSVDNAVQRIREKVKRLYLRNN